MHHGGHGGHGGHHHHGGGRGIGGVSFVPAYVVESCDPALDPYCNPHAMVFGEDEFCVGGSCVAGEYASHPKPEFAGEEGAFMNHVGNAAGIMALGRGAVVLGGLGTLAYLLAHHKVGSKQGF